MSQTTCIRRWFLRREDNILLSVISILIGRELGYIKELRWKTIDQLITSETNIMVYKSLHELAPQYMCNLFTRASQLTSWCLRNTLTDLRLHKKSSKTGQQWFSFRGAKTWNGLSVEGKLASPLTIFLKCI